MEILAPEFDYSLLSSETRIIVQQRTSEIKSIEKRIVSDAIEIGQKLLEVKVLLGHGHFCEWLSREFRWSERTAQNYMMVADKSATVADLESVSLGALYMLVADSTPEEVRQELIDRASSGEKITRETVKSAVLTAKLQAGDVEVVSAPNHPLHGQTVTVEKVDGDIVYVETSDGVQPIAKGWLGEEVKPVERNSEAKPTLSQMLEDAEFALEIARTRSQQLQSLLKDIFDRYDLSTDLVDRARDLGILDAV